MNQGCSKSGKGKEKKKAQMDAGAAGRGPRKRRGDDEWRRHPEEEREGWLLDVGVVVGVGK